ncbi:hypothetical protein AB0G83_34080 [Streptomyces klenkii]|uniref:hypothetical protein n=1 Tax=Streptomyces klenkii TaxID=1420899 RepID=UPI0033F023F4
MDAYEDLDRTVNLITALVFYAYLPDHDKEFVAVVGPALAASLPCDHLPPGWAPDDGPDYPEAGW